MKSYEYGCFSEYHHFFRPVHCQQHFQKSCMVMLSFACIRKTYIYVSVSYDTVYFQKMESSVLHKKWSFYFLQRRACLMTLTIFAHHRSSNNMRRKRVKLTTGMPNCNTYRKRKIFPACSMGRINLCIRFQALEVYSSNISLNMTVKCSKWIQCMLYCTS